MKFWKIAPLAAALVLGTVAGSMLGQPAAAGDWRYRDRVYADSFGNLVVNSAAGYKRIIVGQGHLAKELAEFTGSDEPEVVVVDDRDGRSYLEPRCRPVLLKGRSYMYGLPDGVIPTPGCRH